VGVERDGAVRSRYANGWKLPELYRLIGDSSSDFVVSTQSSPGRGVPRGFFQGIRPSTPIPGCSGKIVGDDVCQLLTRMICKQVPHPRALRVSHQRRRFTSPHLKRRPSLVPAAALCPVANQSMSGPAAVHPLPPAVVQRRAAVEWRSITHDAVQVCAAGIICGQVQR
jgi:hypothetical protein